MVRRKRTSGPGVDCGERGGGSRDGRCLGVWPSCQQTQTQQQQPQRGWRSRCHVDFQRGHERYPAQSGIGRVSITGGQLDGALESIDVWGEDERKNKTQEEPRKEERQGVDRQWNFGGRDGVGKDRANNCIFGVVESSETGIPAQSQRRVQSWRRHRNRRRRGEYQSTNLPCRRQRCRRPTIRFSLVRFQPHPPTSPHRRPRLRAVQLAQRIPKVCTPHESGQVSRIFGRTRGNPRTVESVVAGCEEPPFFENPTSGCRAHDLFLF
mmetsp:Transcript_7441/g.15586  ORF Transcript_7441/g.15586 Transcript_7441/m.15586 type:complete len:266 (+) Transcript_7441:1015-1812(+)